MVFVKRLLMFQYSIIIYNKTNALGKKKAPSQALSFFPLFIDETNLGSALFFCLDHGLQLIPHFFGNSFQQVELSGSFKPLAAIDGDHLPVDVS